MDNLEKKDLNERQMKEMPEDFYARVEEAAREGAKQGARSGGGGGSFLLNLLRVLIMLIPAFIVVILFLRIQSFTGEVKDIFKKDAAVEERDLTLENHGILGYTAADFQEAILGDSKQLKKLEVYKINVSEVAEVTRTGLANLKIFSKHQLITYKGEATYTVDLGQLKKEDITLVDNENEKTVHIKIPRPVLEPINIPEDQIEYGDVEKGLLALGDLKMKAEDISLIQGEARTKMEEKLEKENILKTAERFAVMSVWEIYQPIVDSVTSGYSLEVEF